jgi:hypothetical protein
MSGTPFTSYSIHKTIVLMIQHAFTGSLTVLPAQRKLYFEDGGLVYASSEQTQESFANILLEMNVVDGETLNRVQATLLPGQSLGKKLRDEGIADGPALAQALKQQIMRIVQQVANSKSGEFEEQAGPIPPKVPKLKIHTLPLFLKSCLLVEDPLFPQAIYADTTLRPTRLFALMREELNLPPSYRELMDRIGQTGATLGELQQGTLLELAQVKRLAYILDLLGMADLREEQMSAEIAMGLGEEADFLSDQPLSMELDPMPEEASPYPSLGAALGEELAEPEENTILPQHVSAYGLGEEDNQDGPISFAGLEETTNETPRPNSRDFDLDTEPDLLAKLAKKYPELQPRDEEDPVEALNRALNDGQLPSASRFEAEAEAEEAFNPVEGDQTVPSTPLSSLAEPSETRQAPDFSDYELDDVAEDQGITAPMTIPGEKLAAYADWRGSAGTGSAGTGSARIGSASGGPVSQATPSAPLSPARPKEKTQAARDLTQRGYILPERENAAETKPGAKAARRSTGALVALLFLLLLASAAYFSKPQWSAWLSSNDGPPAARVEALGPPQQNAEQPAPAAQGEPQPEPLQAEPLQAEPPQAEPPQAEPAQPEQPAIAPSETKPPVGQETPEGAKPAPAPSATRPARPNELADKKVAATRESLKSAGASYAIAFIVACEAATLRDLEASNPQEPFGLLPRRMGERHCFIGIWGQFASKEEAAAALPRLPASLAQGEVGWVIDLRPFLN